MVKELTEIKQDGTIKLGERFFKDGHLYEPVIQFGDIFYCRVNSFD